MTNADLKVIKPVLITTTKLGGMKIAIYETEYVAGGLAVFATVMNTGEPYATISERHEDAELGPREFVVQARNLPMHVTMALSLVFAPTGRYHHFEPFKCVEPIWAMADADDADAECPGWCSLDDDGACPQCKQGDER